MPPSQQLSIEQALSKAKKAAKKGNTAAAVKLYGAILQQHPDHPVAKKALRKLQKRRPHHKPTKEETSDPPQEQINTLINLYNSGQIEGAEQFCRSLLNTYPQSLILINILGATLQGQGKKLEAIKSYDKAIQLKPDFAEAYSNRAGVLQELGQLKEALDSCNKAIQLKPDNPVTYNNRGNTLRDLGRPEEALESYDKALQLKPDYAEAYNNRGHALSDLGQLNEAFLSMQTAAEKDPENSWVLDSLIVLLNSYMPNAETSSPYVKAQEALQQIQPGDINSGKITDKTVQQLYQQGHDTLALHNLDINTNRTQLHRGAIHTENCRRHKMVFDRFNVIPERCFGCYKVTLEPRTVMELLKIFILFDRLKLPNDNTRKCTIEVRAEISGTYKGFIYCQSLDEAKELLTVVQTIADESISKDIPIFVKRGCSEFPIAHPEYGLISDDESQLMTYNEEWRKHEASIDNNLIRPESHNANGFTHNHSGLTLLDALVMHNWLAYAETIGDLSHLQIFESHNLCVTDGLKDVMDKRPAF